MNSDQQQLLQLLKIQPYQLHADFSVLSQPSPTSAVTVDPQQIMPTSDPAPVLTVLATTTDVSDMMLTTTTSQLPLDPQLQQLTQDILLLLQTEYPEAQWQASAQFQHCQWQGDLLLTPELAALSSSFYKKQLWQQLTQRQDIPDVSEHSSSHTS